MRPEKVPAITLLVQPLSLHGGSIYPHTRESNKKCLLWAFGQTTIYHFSLIAQSLYHYLQITFSSFNYNALNRISNV